MKQGADIITVGLMEIALLCGCKLSNKGQEFIRETHIHASDKDRRWMDESCTEISARLRRD